MIVAVGDASPGQARGYIGDACDKLQKLMTEIYKSMNHLNPSLIWEFHEKKDVSYNLRIQICANCHK